MRVRLVLQAAGRPLTTAEAIAATHGDTRWTWQALQTLTAAGSIRCATARTAKRGRPSKVYWVEA